MVSSKKIEVTYSDTDMMGVVYHANYIVWFELARTQFLHDMGFTMQDCVDRGLIFPITELNIKYIYPTKYLDNVVVKTVVKQISHVTTTYLHEVYANDELSVVCEVTLAHTDINTFKPVSIKKRFRELFDKYMLEANCG